MFSRPLLSNAGVVLSLTWLISCGSSDAPTQETPAINQPAPTPPGETPATDDAPRDVLVIAQNADIGNLNSVVYETAADAMLIYYLLFPAIDMEFDCVLKTTPALATAWAWSEDGTSLLMTLREDITWEDGETVTAHDIAFTYELISDPEVASPRMGSVQQMVPGTPTVLNDYQLRWQFTSAYDRDTQIAHVDAPPIPKHLFKDADRATLRGHPASLKPMSSGPWRLAKHEPNERIVLEPNPHFTGPEAYKPHLKRVVFRVLPEYATRLSELKSGGVDLMGNLNIADADALRREHPELRIARRGWRSSDYIAWNLDNPMFSSLDVRKALTMAVDIDDMIAKLLTGDDGEVYARASVGTFTPELCAVHNDDIVPLPHDTTQAKALLAGQGWADSDGDGWLDKDGQIFEFTLTTNAGNKRRADASIFVQAFLKEIGVRVHLQNLETNTFFNNLRQRDYEAALGGWEAALFPDPSSQWQSDVSSEERQQYNFTNYSNPRVDELITLGLSEPDAAKSAVYWRELQALVYADQPYMFLWWREELVAVHNRFENTQINVMSRFDDLEKWSVPPDKVKYAR